MSVATLNRAKYSGLDFDTHGDDLRSRLQVQFAADFNDFAISSLGIMLLDLTAYGLDTLSFYVDRRATDLYLSTARTRKSVSRTARQLGYAPGGAVSSGVDVQVAMAQTHAFNVPIPEGFQFKGPNNLIFETSRSVEFTAGDGPEDAISIPCFEGQTLTESFVSDGTAKQAFELRQIPADHFAVQGTVEVKVDGASWDFQKLLEYGATDQFEVGFVDDPVEVRFGDGLAGNIPTTTATIDITYVAARGRDGQIAANTITDAVSGLVVAFEEIALIIDNPEASSGGEDAESLTSIKAFAPQVWKTRTVAVTGTDYSALSGSYADPLFGRVAAAKAISSRSAADDVTLQNFLADLSDAIVLFDPIIQAQTALIEAAVDAAQTASGEITTQLALTTSALADVTTAAGNSRTAARDIKTSAGEIGVDSSDIQVLVVGGNLEVDLYGPAGTAVLLAGEADGIKEYFNRINAESVQILSAAAAVSANGDTIVGESDDSDVAVADATTTLAEITAQLAAIDAELVLIDTANSTILAADTNVVNEVGIATQGIYDHVDALLANDCKANLITVPILTRSAAGFYTAPSTGLIDSLQTFLDARKEVTQTVSVTSGAIFLVPAVISVRVGVLRTYSEAVVDTAVNTAIDGILRDRAFGEDLYESDVETAVLGVDGVVFTNVTIAGYLNGGVTDTGKLDSSGNLVVASSEVVTKGTTTITTELFTGT